jgi:electron transfer flavoprotein alpha subunit
LFARIIAPRKRPRNTETKDMPILVIAEHDNAGLKAATLNTVSAAARLGADIEVLVAGSNCAAAAQAAAQLAGVAKVKVADAAAYAEQGAENLAALLVGLVQAGGYSHVLAPATTYGKNVLPRVAALLDVAQISDIVAIESADTFVRPIYAGNALATVKSSDAVKVITVRTTAFDAVGTGGAPRSKPSPPAPTWPRASSAASSPSRPAPSWAPPRSSSPAAVAWAAATPTAAVLEPLADKLGAAMGASRAAVDAGFVPNDYQVGQTGKIVAPQLYLAVGISGAIQHLAGMKDSKVIVAINKDPEAPIFQVADYGLVADLFEPCRSWSPRSDAVGRASARHFPITYRPSASARPTTPLRKEPP